MSSENLFLAAIGPNWIFASAMAWLMNRQFPCVEPTRKSNQPSLDVLRGLAAFLVLTAHVTMYFAPPNSTSIVSSLTGSLGVMMFFMLTGNLFWSQVAAGKFKLDGFYVKRFRRLVPLVIVVVGTVTFIDWVQAGTPKPSVKQILTLIKNFGFGFNPVADVFGPDMLLRINTIWSLRWECLFYLMLPLVAIRPSFLALTAWAIGIVMVFYEPQELLSGRSSEATFILAFYLGAGSHYLGKLTASSQRRNWATAVLFMMVWSSLALCKYLYLGPSPSEPSIRKSGFVAISFGLFLPFVFVSATELKSQLARMTAQLGQISYSLYLWHLSIVYYGMKVLDRVFSIERSLLFLPAFTVFTAIAVVVAHFSYRHIELPFLKSGVERT
jgi:peptidoglycan/LPS O-acetylase OafA/YrhL